MKGRLIGLLASCLLIVMGSAQTADGRANAKAEPMYEAIEAVELPALYPAPCITYRQHGLRRVYSGCEPPIQALLEVENPCCCGPLLAVPVCLPACCTDVPDVSSRRGLLGRGIVTYSYCCGLTIKVVFERCGDVTVHYYGRF